MRKQGDRYLFSDSSLASFKLILRCLQLLSAFEVTWDSGHGPHGTVATSPMAGRRERTVELTTPGVCLALAFAEQLSSHGDVHGLLFGVWKNCAQCALSKIFALHICIGINL